MIPTFIKKRDGHIEDFEEDNVRINIQKALDAVESTYRADLIYDLLEVRYLFHYKKDIISVEELSDFIEETFMREGLYDAARAYITYRFQRKLFRQKKDVVSKIVNEYIDKKTWRVNENSNITYSYPAMQGAIANNVISNYVLSSVYPQNIADAHLTGDLHIHDLSMGTAGYCAGWDLGSLLLEGFGGVPGKLNSRPPSHLSSAVDQMINFLGVLQNEWAGAMAYNSFDTFLAPYIKIEGLDKKAVKQCMENFIYGVNVTSRWGQCVKETTEVLTPEGFKGIDTLKVGDNIYTAKDNTLSVESVKAINIFDYDGELHQYSSRDYCQTVTPNHRVVYLNPNTRTFVLKPSSEIIETPYPLSMPIAILENNLGGIDLTNSEIIFLTFLLTKGNLTSEKSFAINIRKPTTQQENKILVKSMEELGISYTIASPNTTLLDECNYYFYKIKLNEYKKGYEKDYDYYFYKTKLDEYKKDYYYINDSCKKYLDILRNTKQIPDLFLQMNRNQAKLFLDTWLKLDGQQRRTGCWQVQCDDINIANKLQHIAVLAGKGSTIEKKQIGKSKKITFSVIIYNRKVKQCIGRKVNYKGRVWCPTTDAGIIIYRENGRVFISGNSPFVNITLDLQIPKDLATNPVIIAGKDTGFTYSDCQAESNLLNEAFWEVMLEGDANELPFTFPIPTVNITKEFDFDSKIARLIFEVAGKYGLPYFQNFVNSNLRPTDVRSMCCRLQLRLDDLRKHTGGIFGSNSSTGSIGVVTLNLPRLGYTCKTEEELFDRLDFLSELAKDSLIIKRKVINENLNRGLFPYTNRYLGTFKRHFSTIGIIGGHELCLNFLKKGIDTAEGKELVTRILLFLREKTEQFTKETGDLFNLEATPAEGATYSLALLDKKQFPDIITSGENVPFYSNSSQLPVNYTDDLFEALDHQDSLQCLYTSGTVFHAFLGEKLNAEGTKTLVKKICNTYKLPFFSITPTFSICPDHKYISGEHSICPRCGKTTLIFTRVVGYLRSVDSWNLGKQEEFKNRKEYK